MIQVFSDIDMSLVWATLNMACALALGAIIGTERQYRGRMAGLRTNALVSLGAAGFVTFAALFPEDINPTRVAAQVVSGIGFLGAGIIFRDGFNIQGINTAATLWCSAGVGMISGSGHLLYAVSLTALIVFTNLGLRPVVKRLKNAAERNIGSDQLFDLTLECAAEDEKDVRAILIAAIGDHMLDLFQIASRADGRTAEIVAQVSVPQSAGSGAQQVIAKVSLSPSVRRAVWCASDDSDADL